MNECGTKYQSRFDFLNLIFLYLLPLYCHLIAARTNDNLWISALYGVLFPMESVAAFSSYRIWESCGYVVAFAISNALCTRVKISILTSALVIGMLGFYSMELLLKNRQMKRVAPEVGVEGRNVCH